jgi:hypothetical protein
VVEEEAKDQERDKNKKQQKQQKHGCGGAIGGADGLRHLAGRSRAACGVSHRRTRRPAAHRVADMAACGASRGSHDRLGRFAWRTRRLLASRVASSSRTVFP